MADAAAFELGSVPWAELQQMLQRVEPQIQAGDLQLIRRVLSTLEWIQRLLGQKDLSLKRLLRRLFGPRTEKSPQTGAQSGSAGSAAGVQPAAGTPQPKRRKGHGRLGAKDYPGAQHVAVGHPQLQPGDGCPACHEGKLYRLSEPARVLHLIAQPIFPATVYELEKLRCNHCGQVATAPAPPQAATQKPASSSS